MRNIYYEMHNDFYSIEPAYDLYVRLGQIYMTEIDWYIFNIEIIDNV